MKLGLLLCVSCVIGFGVVTADSTTQYDTIVVGLGAAGATAAATLARAGRRVLALEAAPRVGGRVRTEPFGNGLVELGAEWMLGTEHSRTYEAAIQHNISLVPQALDRVWYHSDGTTADSGLINQLLADEVFSGGSEPAEAQGNFSTRKIMDRVRENKPELLKDQDFIEELLRSADLMIANLEGSDTWNDVTTGGAYEDLGGNQDMSWHRYGYKTFIEIMLNTYKGGPGLPNLDMKLGTEVTHISCPRRPGERVAVTSADGGRHEADTVIVTVSLGVLKAKHSTLFSPPLPKEKQTAIDQISMGVLDKIILSFNEAWLPHNSSSMFMWKRADRKKVPSSDEWTTKIVGASRPMGSTNTLTLWISGDAAKKVETIPEDSLKTKCVEFLQKFIGDTLKITVPEPTAIIRTTWYSSPYTRGSYSYDNVLTSSPSPRPLLAAPLRDDAGAPRILFGGEATNEKHFGTVHGASETGYREAVRVLNTGNE